MDRPFHLILLARGRPSIPPARLYAHNALLVLDKDDLRFTQEEIRTYLSGAGYTSLSQPELERLAEGCEGWVAALQLGVLSSKQRGSVAELIASLRGDSDWIAHYLADEVLHRQGAETGRLLLQTSILDAFNAPLCAAVTGMDDAEALLARLVRRDLFVIELDQAQGWFRYHHLFQDLLQNRLKADSSTQELADLHRRAADWLLDKGNLYSGVGHLLAAGDVDRACAVVADAVHALGLRDPYQARRLLNLLPPAQLTQRPRLILERCRLTLLFDEGDLEACVAQAKQALDRMSGGEADYPRLWAEYLVYRSAALFRRQAYDEMAETIAQALSSVHLLDDFMAASLYFLHMHLGFAQGRDAEAAMMGERAVAAHMRAQFGAGVVAIRRELAKWAMRRGDADEADRRIRRMRDEHRFDGPMSAREYALTYLYAAEHRYWQDDLAGAREYQQDLLGLAHTLQGDSLINMGDLLAWACAEEAQALAEEGQSLTALSGVFVHRACRAHAIDVAIRTLASRGHYENAWKLALELGLLAEPPLPEQNDRVLMAYGLAYVARGVALDALTPLLEDALANRRLVGNRFGELHLLAIMAWQRLCLRGARAAAAILHEATKMAQATQYVRVLRNLPGLAPLLDQVHALSEGVAGSKSNGIALTDQEHQVLMLLDADHTYPEIAEQLTVSVNTVCTHVRKLYGKLSVHRRAQAFNVAWTHGLLPNGQAESRNRHR
jgi:ATP/maltotriose-dependent transcriptional regulator MalT